MKGPRRGCMEYGGAPGDRCCLWLVLRAKALGSQAQSHSSWVEVSQISAFGEALRYRHPWRPLLEMHRPRPESSPRPKSLIILICVATSERMIQPPVYLIILLSPSQYNISVYVDIYQVLCVPIEFWPELSVGFVQLRRPVQKPGARSRSTPRETEGQITASQGPRDSRACTWLQFMGKYSATY